MKTDDDPRTRKKVVDKTVVMSFLALHLKGFKEDIRETSVIYVSQSVVEGHVFGPNVP